MAVFVLSISALPDGSVIKYMVKIATKIIIYLWFGGLGMGAIFALAISLAIPKKILRYFRSKNLEMEIIWIAITTSNIVIFFFTPIGDFMNGDLLWKIIGSFSIPIILFKPSSVISLFKRLP